MGLNVCAQASSPVRLPEGVFFMSYAFSFGPFSVRLWPMMPQKIHIAGVNFDPVRYDQALDRIAALIQSGVQHYGVTPNPEMLLNASRDPEFRNILNGASLSVADGVGVLWAATFLQKASGLPAWLRLLWLPLSLAMVLLAPARLRQVLPQRVAGSDLLFGIAERSQNAGWRIFLLGAAPGVAEAARQALLKKYPHANIAGSYAGSPKAQDWEAVRSCIHDAQPNVLLIAYGSPAQERWIAEHLAKLPSVRFAMGIGGAFDFAAGRIRRAPKAFQRLGLEWLWRLVLQPSRWRRIVNATWRFAGLVFGQKKDHSGFAPD